MAMKAKEYMAKMYAEHPELPEMVAEVERLYGARIQFPCMVIEALLDGMTPAEVAADSALMDL